MKQQRERLKGKASHCPTWIRKSIEYYCPRIAHEEEHVLGGDGKDQYNNKVHAETETSHAQAHEASRELISTLQQELTAKNTQIEEFLKQQDQGQQLAAMQQKTIAKLTEQNQQLHEASQEKEEKKVGFWSRLIGQRAWFSLGARIKPLQITT